MVHDSKQNALAGLGALPSTATQVPPRGAHTLVFTVQSAVQIPLPTPPGEVAERLSLDRMHVRPAQSPLVWQAAPKVVLPGGPASAAPPLPPAPDAPETPLPPVPLVVGPPPLVDELAPPAVAVLPVVDELIVGEAPPEPVVTLPVVDELIVGEAPPVPVVPLPVVVLEPVTPPEPKVPPVPIPPTSGPASDGEVNEMTRLLQPASSRARRHARRWSHEIMADSCNLEARRATVTIHTTALEASKAARINER
jgi:hypothetical protein